MLLVGKKNSYFFVVFSFIFLFAILPLSFLVGGRDISIGTDTENYYNLYYWFVESKYMALEPGIYIFAYISDLLNGGAFLFFSSIFIFYYFCISFSYYNFFYSKLALQEFLVFYVFIWGALLASSWFQVATINVLRHGLALTILYSSASMLMNKKYMFGGCLYVVSILFHYSLIMVFPFVFLFLLKERMFYFSYFLLAVFYPLGVNEVLISFLSSITGIPLYSLVSSYAEDNLLYVGFNLYFYLYTIFWTLSGLFVIRFFCRPEMKSLLKDMLRIYSVLSMIYFVFGFAAFSNRYAFFSWLFIPFLQTALMSSVNVISNIKAYIALLFLIIGFINYYFLF
ncbi:MULTISPECIES: EpsG family protein [Vibrio]|uniref:EpsG family protein n=1 Tax=Vibrio TaxID=662 RepID=UPI00102DAC00|nr:MULTISPECIES: EpsG family protein [Vibrio]MCF7509167.1 EpsG family protein [Vibrio sp. D54]RZV23010.1 EpsG family protein [Vibrio alginolyticus]